MLFSVFYSFFVCDLSLKRYFSLHSQHQLLHFDYCHIYTHLHSQQVASSHVVYIIYYFNMQLFSLLCAIRSYVSWSIHVAALLLGGFCCLRNQKKFICLYRKHLIFCRLVTPITICRLKYYDIIRMKYVIVVSNAAGLNEMLKNEQLSPIWSTRLFLIYFSGSKPLSMWLVFHQGINLCNTIQFVNFVSIELTIKE